MRCGLQSTRYFRRDRAPRRCARHKVVFRLTQPGCTGFERPTVHSVSISHVHVEPNWHGRELSEGFTHLQH